MFNGQNYAISDLSVTGSVEDSEFFGVIGSTAVIEYVPISGSVSVTGYSSVDAGILAGRLEGSVIGVSTAGTVSGAASDGGQVGTNAGGSITDSDSTATVTGNDANIGGLVGNQNSGTVQNVYATGTVSNSGSEYSGGLIGDLEGGTLVTGYAVGKVSGGYAGAILGLYDSYSSPMVSSVYFDPVLSGTSHAVGFNSASGITASTNLTSESTLSGWNFTSVWHLSPTMNNGFPYLLATHVIRISSPLLSVWTLPVITTEPVTIGKNTSQVIGNMGYNAVQAITEGSAPGYEEERAAIQTGASATGEGATPVTCRPFYPVLVSNFSGMCQPKNKVSLPLSISTSKSSRHGRIIQ